MNRFLRKLNPYVDVIWGIGGGLLIGVINFPFLINLNVEEINPAYLFDKSEGPIGIIKVLIVAIFIAPFLEELFFRVYLFRKIRDKFDLFWGYTGSTFLFVLAHSLLRTGGFITLTVHSLIITYIYQKTDSITAIFLTHSLWNLTWYLGVYSKM